MVSPSIGFSRLYHGQIVLYMTYTADGDKTRYATLEEENKALRLQVAELSMERDMLKKATAYFANLKG